MKCRLDEILGGLPETSKILIFAKTIGECKYLSSTLTREDLYCLTFDLNS